MAVNRIVRSTLDKRSNYERNRDRLGRVRKTGYSSRYNNPPSRGIGSNYKYLQYNKNLDVRKKIFKPYGRNNLSLMNRRYYNRGNIYTSRNNIGVVNNNRRILSRYDDKGARGVVGRRAGEPFNRKIITPNYRDSRDRSRRISYKNNNKGGNRRIFYDSRRNMNNKNRNLHGKVGKLTAKDLDAELDAYMGANNVKSRLDNELDSYFKNNSTAQATDTNNNWNGYDYKC